MAVEFLDLGQFSERGFGGRCPLSPKKSARSKRGVYRLYIVDWMNFAQIK